MREERIKKDITVAGGGLSGICAAIAAARLGRSVALVQNRPVLGGNSSSEIRVWVSGASATGVNRYARETGIMGELYLENQYRNPQGNPYIWDLILLEAVKAEPGISLFLNTEIMDITAFPLENGRRRITLASGWMSGSERKLSFESEVYIDCTGDGLAGCLAGAEYRIGREAASEFNENLAPEIADDLTLGSTIFFYTKDTGEPVTFVRPSFAKRIEETSIPIKRVIRSGDSGCHYWWIEWGGEWDTVHDNESIRDELWSAIYGIWDYIKNSGQFEAANLTLEWVGAVPGKREYRRFVGDYMLNQNDVIEQTDFPDAIAFGGWSIDLHPPQGMYASTGGSRHFHPDGIYSIPFRSLYSVNVDNLLFAGRNISATHIAFGTTRVMATCAIMGEAAGTAAALCVEKQARPRQLYEQHIRELQQTLLKQDASLIGIANRDEEDLAASARVSASSYCARMEVAGEGEAFRLCVDVAMLFPVNPLVTHIDIRLDADEATVLEAELWNTGRGENYVPHTMILSASVEVERGEEQWARLILPWSPDMPQNAFLIIKANAKLSLRLSCEPHAGMLAFVRQASGAGAGRDLLEEKEETQGVLQWSMKPVSRRLFHCRIYPETQAFAPRQIINGYRRPFAGPNQWLSGRMEEGKAEWLRLDWDSPVSIREVHVILNDDVNEYLNNLHFLRTPFEIIPELLKDYEVEIREADGSWRVAATITNNRKRKNIIQLAEQVETDALRLQFGAVNGSPYAGVVEVRVYR
ncbi:FAD-dependent oxidoreductase [Paenibacillus sp. HB172176]|uniref:FAD-dependent oxidoreductase n=1 Tax=Paenibacillus sp. HB172176 TaxID=2493690 RepID=UPI00143AFFCD|nr:FAD-dependent oxidoreductase [Paenibacillus sp. HB172176]